MSPKVIFDFELFRMLGWSSDGSIGDMFGSSLNNLHEIVDVLIEWDINGS